MCERKRATVTILSVWEFCVKACMRVCVKQSILFRVIINAEVVHVCLTVSCISLCLVFTSTDSVSVSILFLSCSPHPGGKRQLPHPQRDSLHHPHPQDPTQPTLQKQKPRLQSPQPKWWPSRLQNTLPNHFQNRPLGWPVNRNPATHPAPKPCRPGLSEVPG